ncbi:MAG: tetratricopeptide repeat protein [Actinomycetota bacterium]|nr:tetratricopeptide repeat protein [Actinomycetota bacterium]
MALDVEPAHTYPWIDAAAPTHPSLIDTRHVTGELFGFINIPMAVWIDETGTIVRNAESATVERSPLRDMDIPEGLDERLTRMLTEVKAIPDDAAAYRAAIVDWARNGAESPYALTPDEVIERSRPRGGDEARAAACFEIGQHLRDQGDADAAVPWWRQAHELDPGNWTYKRQAWTLVTTPPGAAENDLMQGPNDVYDGNWLDDVLASGGGEHYAQRPRL